MTIMVAQLSEQDTGYTPTCLDPYCGDPATTEFDSDKGRTYRFCASHLYPTIISLLQFGMIREATNFRAVRGAASDGRTQ